jgi:hypothetical protein
MAREKKAALHVRIHQRVILLGTGVDQVLIVPRSRVIDQNIQPAKLLHRKRHTLFGGHFLSRIASKINSLAAFRANPVAQLAQTLFAPSRHHQICTLRCHGKRRRPANSRAGSGDQN